MAAPASLAMAVAVVATADLGEDGRERPRGRGESEGGEQAYLGGVARVRGGEGRSYPLRRRQRRWLGGEARARPLGRVSSEEDDRGGSGLD